MNNESRVVYVPRRLGLTFYAGQYLSPKEVSGIAKYLRVPINAMNNNLLHTNAYESKVPVHFHVMSRMKVPDNSAAMQMGVAVLPSFLMTGANVNPVYTGRLAIVIEAVLNGLPVPSTRYTTVMDVTYEAMRSLKEAVDAHHDCPGRPERELKVHVTPGVCAAYYQSIKIPETA